MNSVKKPFYKPFYLIMLIITTIICTLDTTLSIGSFDEFTFYIRNGQVFSLLGMIIMLMVTIMGIASLVLLYCKKFSGLIIQWIAAAATCFAYFLFAADSLLEYFNSPEARVDSYSNSVDLFFKSNELLVMGLIITPIILLVSVAFCTTWYFAWKNQQVTQNNFNKEGSTVSNL
jgi:hypothetical protein